MLKLTIRNLGDATIFRCEGGIVFPEAETLRVAFLRHPGIRLAVLDLADINSIDAAGLGILISLRAWSRATGAKLKLMNLKPRVEYLLMLTHLRPLFEVCSVRDVLELFCLALNRSRLVEKEAAPEISAEVLDDASPISNEAQW